MKLATTIAVILLFHTLTFSATIYVPDDHSTIQGAIDAAVNGDKIIVRQGNYLENINFLGKAITVISETGPSATVIDGGQNGSVVTFESREGATSRIVGFTLKNGFAMSGGGILCSYASPIIADNVITNNVSDFHGGGIFCEYSAAVITGNTITDNEADFYGSGIYCYSYASPTITENEISYNHADGFAGGIYCSSGSSPTISENVFTHNTCYDGGGGIFCDGPAIISSNTFIENISYEDGGGVKCSNNASPTITGNHFVNNEASRDGGAICGGGCVMTVTNNIMAGNWARFQGGGYATGWSTTATLTNNTIVGNTTDLEGGGIHCSEKSDLTVSNTILWNNHAPEGPEIWIGNGAFPSTLTISHCDLDGGQASIYLDSGCTLNMGAGMIDADPLFVDPANGDYHLFFHSPCSDAGDASAPGLPSEDFEGDPRSASNGVDVGADEFYFHLYSLGEVIPGNVITIRVTGQPDMATELFLGPGVRDPAMPTIYGDFYVKAPVTSFYFGRTAANGVIDHQATVPPTWQSGNECAGQALVGSISWPSSRLTNLIVLTVVE